MAFISIQFVVFFMTVAVLYYAVPHRFRWGLLLCSGLVFYGSSAPWCLLLLAAVTVIAYAGGVALERYGEGKTRTGKIILAAAITLLLGILGGFKYLNFFNSVISDVAVLAGLKYPAQVLNIILPLGISFYIFQAIAYLVDVYRGTYEAERHFGIFAVYQSFFPQILAGPIPRPSQLLPQFREEHGLDPDSVAEGLKRMAWGFFKKAVIADRAAIIVNAVFDHPHEYSGIYLILAMLLFTLQIYCDFSGYSDIAIGAGRVLGFRLMENFRRPYMSMSMTEFWRRWHISLSTWFRDYLYIPLGGNRVRPVRRQLNLLITFLMSGLWHGAGWNFIVWGALHGLFIVIGIWTARVRDVAARVLGLKRFPALHDRCRQAVTFLLAAFAWIFFRANSLGDAVYIVTHLGSGVGSLIANIVAGNRAAVRAATDISRNGMTLGFAKESYNPEMLILVVAILVLWLVDAVEERSGNAPVVSSKPSLVRLGLYYLLVCCIIFFGMFSSQQFIYFRF
ncbi:MAG TPA: MBOAT family O-acyltransferase [Spirochaetota bacterium]|nr:MBOAT family O-acyltransferase [Spirochaetota bacterium]HPL16708.1 MBOAT family O-acyltransferase [Spirochaetota bacterium]HQF10388.1 MBOAT family O-acyltransferase [Spirochaetota bacterium]HQH99261.1 MBOAT family O-acyltransferase [Spirochaetota bacterium]HQJ71060.1 MBOAT family O-acyltransferase [Spirochaetota bacterium]